MPDTDSYDDNGRNPDNSGYDRKWYGQWHYGWCNPDNSGYEREWHCGWCNPDNYRYDRNWCHGRRNSDGCCDDTCRNRHTLYDNRDRDRDRDRHGQQSTASPNTPILGWLEKW